MLRWVLQWSELAWIPASALASALGSEPASEPALEPGVGSKRELAETPGLETLAERSARSPRRSRLPCIRADK